MRLSRIWDHLWKFIRTKKVWRFPVRSDVLIYDACGHENLVIYLGNQDYQILYIRNEEINVPVLLLSFFKKGNPKISYIDCYIEIVSPLLILTSIDNSINFLSLSSKHPSCKTVFVQNGWRGYYADIFEILDKPKNVGQIKYRVDYMLTHGAITGKEFNRYITGTVEPVGSIKNNIIPVSKVKQNNLLAFLSQWHDEGLWMNGKYYSHNEFFKRTDKLVLQILEDYAQNNGKRLVVIPRYTEENDKFKEEKSYYNAILKNGIEFICPKSQYPSYEAIDQAEVVVSIDSTLGYEAVARGTKTAIFSVRGVLLDLPGFSFGWPGEFPDTGLFWSNIPDHDIFFRILNYLFDVDPTQWEKDNKSIGFSDLMFYGPGNNKLLSIFNKIGVLIESKSGYV